MHVQLLYLLYFGIHNARAEATITWVHCNEIIMLRGNVNRTLIIRNFTVTKQEIVVSLEQKE